MLSRWWNLQERMMRQNPQLSLSRRFPNSDPFSTWYSCARPCRWTGRLAQQCPCEQRWLLSTRLIFPAWWRSAMFQVVFFMSDIWARSSKNGLFQSDCPNAVGTSVLLTARRNYINAADCKSLFHFIWNVALWFVFDVTIHRFPKNRPDIKLNRPMDVFRYTVKNTTTKKFLGVHKDFREFLHMKKERWVGWRQEGSCRQTWTNVRRPRVSLSPPWRASTHR